MKYFVINSIFVLSFFAVISTAHANDDIAKAKLAEAQTLYNSRTDAVKVESALNALTTAENEAVEANLKYDILVFTSKILYWKGDHATTDGDKVQLFDAGRAKAGEAKEANDSFGDAYYWYAANLARWGEANGVVASLSKKKELIRTLEELATKTNRDGSDGSTYEWHGSDRILGRVYFKLPGFAGGSLDKSLTYLDSAYNAAKEYANNVVWYAESLSNGTAEQKEKAKQILKEMLAKDPASYNGSRVPETKDEFQAGKALLQEIGG